MDRIAAPSLRTLLLASAAGFATLASGGGARATPIVPNNVTVSTQRSGLTTLLQLLNGQTLTVTGTGGLTIGSTAVGSQPAVGVGVPGVAAILNSGTIASDQTAAGLGAGIEIGGGASLGSIINNVGGTIRAIGPTASAIWNDGTLNAIANAGLILATGTNAAAIRNNYQYIGSISNAAGAVIEATGSGGVAIENTGTLPPISNSGLIQATGTSGVAVLNQGYSYKGSITNNVGGVIRATGASGKAIENDGSLGAIVNAGSILATAQNGEAIYANYGWIGSIANVAGGLIAANGGNAIAIDNGYAWIGSITNAAGAVIEANGAGGTAIENTGTVGAIANRGLVQATGTNGVAISNQGYNYIGSLTNSVGGIIQATGSTGIAIENAGTLNALANAGLIQATGSDGIAIDNTVNSYTWAGTIDNAVSGVIQATGTNGIAIENAETLQSLVNAGTIRSLLGPAIVNDRSIVNGITNVAGGLIQGGPANGSGIAIDSSGAAFPLSVLNAGTIVGAIKQSSYGDTLTVAGGAIVGNVVGKAGTHGVADFALGAGSFTLGGNILGVDTVNVLSGLVAMAPRGGAVSGAQALNISPGAAAAIGGTVGAALTTNNGVLEATTGSATLQGNYVQGAGGGLKIDIGATGPAVLTITGTGTITPGPKSVLLHFTGPANLPATSTILVARGGLTLTSGTTLTAVSDSPSPYFSTPTVTDPVGTLTLTFAVPTHTALLSYAAGLFPAGSAYLTSAAAAFASRINALSASSFTAITDAIAALPPDQRIAFAQQMAPRSVASAAAELANGLGANTALGHAISSHQAGLHTPDSLFAGHGTMVWAQPFGSTAYQSAQQDFGGFAANTYGAAFGADTLVSPDLRIGFAFAAANSNINYTGGASASGDTISTAQLGVYASYVHNNFFFDGALAGGYDWYTSKQNMAFLGQQHGSYSGAQFDAQGRVGYEMPFGGATLTPSASLRELHMNFGSYTMSGGSGPSAHVNSISLDLVQSRVGARLAYTPAKVGAWLLRPEVHAYYLHNFNTSGVTTSGSFSNGLGFAVEAPSRDANLGNIGFDVTASRVGPLTLGASASYTTGRSTNIGTFLLHVATKF